jgi:hypothetical protein
MSPQTTGDETMSKQIEQRLDKLVLFDKIAAASRLIRGEQKREGLIADRRRVARVPGAVVQFIPAEWLASGGISHSYSSQLCAS